MKKMLAALVSAVFFATTFLATPALAAPAAAPQARASAQATDRVLYDVDFFVGERVGAKDVRKLKLKPKKAWDELHRCFNCSFPVDGAPKKFPSENQYIKLKACGIGHYACKNAPVRYHKSNSYPYTWFFLAQKGHFDGKDSMVRFRFYDDKQGFLHLKVYATVTHPTVPDSVNKEFATMKWRAFAHILGMHLE
ncbi:hypothetical protein ACPCBC_13880 [Streptomyces incarnatus]|uniref:hypothetical protein n=1 Tax=unclassified Streptomyces TaxID=2593676 RepID=UPI0011A5D4BD|nr:MULTISPECIES: hypothetical protein [Streptomyces]QHC31971.1 hypothetical protein GR129_27405 [Streptomyces sp. HF10]WKE69049.1 hypothetical protein QHG49_08430 [Streptomyces sp. WP-1]